MKLPSVLTPHFLQTGDIHIGECRALPDYLDRHEKVLWQIANLAIANKLPLLMTGDLFHLKSTKHEERWLAARWIGYLEENEVHSIFIDGNHDHLYGEFTQMMEFSHMPLKYVRMVAWSPRVVNMLGVSYLAIPWRNYEEDQIRAIVTAHLLQMTSDKKVVILHECIKGALADNGFVIPGGTSLPNMPEITYWAVGDIHKVQKTNLDNGWYAGAPAQFKFLDQHSKGILAVDLASPCEPHFIPIASKPMRVVSSVSQITDDAYYQVRGNASEIMKASGFSQVVNTSYDELVAGVDGGIKPITEGLDIYLLDKGIPESYHSYAVDWVEKLLTGTEQG